MLSKSAQSRLLLLSEGDFGAGHEHTSHTPGRALLGVMTTILRLYHDQNKVRQKVLRLVFQS